MSWSICAMRGDRTLLMLAGVALLSAADPAWKTKPVAQWDEEDAKQVLTGSAWVKRAVPVELPQLSPDQRREGGATGGGRGLGLGGLEGRAPTSARAARLSQLPAFTIRWESAFPIRTAELKAHEMGAPDWEGDAYVLAVYNVPGIKFTGGQKTQAGGLKQGAFLKREGKKDLRPSSVQLMQEPNGLAVVVYVFPRSEEISREDKRVEFVAQIDRLSLAQDFYPAEMEMEGKLQL
jgi:hypothetical protein